LSRFSFAILVSIFLLNSNSILAADQKTAEKPATAPTQKGKKVSNPIVIIETSKGPIEAELYADKAPITVKNFMAYVDDKFFDGTIFHRVINNFMIQGGGFTPDMKQKDTKAPIKNEATNGLKNTRGTLAMARTNVVDSATAQFFINHKDNDFLDNSGTGPQTYGYAVFGKVTKGLETVDAIATVPTKNAGFMQDVPADPITIKSIRKK